MSINSTEAESRKPKPLRTSIANRDKPLFTGRRPHPRQQQRPDFFTESLNTSYIPTPSPTKKTARPSSGVKPRQGAINGKPRVATFSTGTSDAKKGSKVPSPTSPTARKSQEQPSRISQHVPRVSASSTGTKSFSSRPTTRTPSPSRLSQQQDPISPTSESSPPRGLAEAYQRIEDEEHLAGQEDESVDDLVHPDDASFGMGEDMDQESRLDDWEVGSPASNNSPRRTSPRSLADGFGGAHGSPSHHEHRPPSSGEDSTMSFPANAGEDTFDRVLTQYDKDHRRVKEVLGSDLKPFKKSRIKERAGLTVENLQRKDASSKSGSSTLGSPSVSSKASDLSLNIPPGWGRKGRGSNTWLSRISRENGKFTGDKSNLRHLQPEEIFGHADKRSSSPIMDWIAAASQVPLPSVESDSMRTSTSSRRLTPTSQLQRQTSNERIRRWEFLDDDFTARSLQVSDSPPIRIKNGTLDAIREREIENLEKSAVTTNRLGELKEKRSLDQVKRKASTEALEEDRNGVSAKEPGRRVSSKSSLYPPSEADELELKRHESLSEDENGNVTRDGLLASFGQPKNEHDSEDIEAMLENRPSKRPSAARHDSRDLLRKLARATSASPAPSPVRPEFEPSHQANPRLLTVEIIGAIRSELQPMKEGGPLGDPDQQAAQTESIEQERLAGMNRQPVQNTPQQPKPNVYLKTPLITGAWIDTPLPIGGRGPPMPTPEILEDEDEPDYSANVTPIQSKVNDIAQESVSVTKPKLPPRPSLAETAPLLPKSALAAIIEKAKTNANRPPRDPKESSDDTLILDDSTIQSLEELLASDTSNPDVLTPPISTNPSSPPGSNHKSNPPTATLATVQEQEEASSYNHLTSRLFRLGSSIRDAKMGIASLERAVSAVPSTPSAIVPSNECNEAGEFHDFIWPCEKCGSLSRDGATDWQAIHISIPRLWTWRREDRLPRLTKLGIITAAAWALIVAEWIAQ